MYLGNTRTCSSFPFHHALARVTSEANPEDFLGALPKVLPYYPFDVLPFILWSVVKHLCEHLLEFGRKNGRLHGNCLSDFEVETSIRSKEIDETFGISQVQCCDRVCEEWVRAEVDLVVNSGY